MEIHDVKSGIHMTPFRHVSVRKSSLFKPENSANSGQGNGSLELDAGSSRLSVQEQNSRQVANSAMIPHVFDLSRMGEEDGFGEQQKFNREIQQVFLDYYISLLHDYSLYICESQGDFVLFDKVSQAKSHLWTKSFLLSQPHRPWSLTLETIHCLSFLCESDLLTALRKCHTNFETSLLE